MVIRIDAGGGGRRTNPMAGDALPAVVSAEDGTFRVHGVTAGVWSLDVESDGFAPKNMAGLKLVEGSGADVGDVTLEAGAVLSGIVTTTSGEPIPFARGRVSKEFTLLGQFTAEIDGSFQTRSLKAGEAVTLTVDADGYGSVEKAGLTPPAEALTIALPAASRVSGTVVDKETNQPIPDFSVSVSRNRNMGAGMARMTQMMQGPETAFHDDRGAFTVDGVEGSHSVHGFSSRLNLSGVRSDSGAHVQWIGGDSRRVLGAGPEDRRRHLQRQCRAAPSRQRARERDIQFLQRHAELRAAAYAAELQPAVRTGRAGWWRERKPALQDLQRQRQDRPVKPARPPTD